MSRPLTFRDAFHIEQSVSWAAPEEGHGGQLPPVPLPLPPQLPPGEMFVLLQACPLETAAHAMLTVSG